MLVNYTMKKYYRHIQFLFFEDDEDKLGIGGNFEEGHDYWCCYHKLVLSYLFPNGKAVVRSYQQLDKSLYIHKYVLLKLATDLLLLQHDP